VHDWGRGLSVRHLLVGTSEKPEWSRGRFGEGLKLALMVLANQGVPVYIRSGDREIKPTFVTANIEDTSVELFCVCYKKVPEAVNGTEVHIGDPTLCNRFMSNFVQGLPVGPVSCIAYARMEKRDSMPMRWEHILDCDEARGKIYVRDIYVRDMPALFGYNLFDVKLSESRDVASESDIRQGIEDLWDDLIHDLYKERVNPGTYEPQMVKRWTEVLMKLISGALGASMAQGNVVETEVRPFAGTREKEVVTDLFTKMYGEDAVVVTTPEMLGFAKYVGMKPVYFCTTPFCTWLFYVTNTVERMNKKVGKATATVPKDKLPAPLKCVIDDLEKIAYYVVSGIPMGVDLLKHVEYGYLKEGICGQTDLKPSTRIIISVPCLEQACKYNFVMPGMAASKCIEEYMKILLHELAHAVSGAPDGDTLFEMRLTEFLGNAVGNTISFYKDMKQYVDDIVSVIMGARRCE